MLEGVADPGAGTAFGVVVSAEFGVGLGGGQDAPHGGEDGGEGALVAASDRDPLAAGGDPSGPMGNPWGMRRELAPRVGTNAPPEAPPVTSAAAFPLASSKTQHRDMRKAGGFRLPPFRCVTPSQRRFLCAREELKLSSIQQQWPPDKVF